jgi:hypothetical protein
MLVNLVRSSIVFCLVLLFVEQTRGQSPTLSPEKLGYSAHELVHSDLGTVNYFVRNQKRETEPAHPSIPRWIWTLSSISMHEAGVRVDAGDSRSTTFR